MARDRRSIGALAEEVLAQIEAPVVKTASVAYDMKAMQTDLGKQIQKVAAALREDADAPVITYADLQAFRRGFGV